MRRPPAPPVVSEPAIEVPQWPLRPRAIQAGLRLTVRGRSVHLRRLRRPPTGLMRWLVILGPGVIAASAANEAGGIATYSAAGAKFGYSLLWVLVLIALCLAVVQETCSRLGAATGRGLLDLIRERYGIGWTLLAVSVVLLANGSVTITEFAGIGAAMELFGISKYVVVPLAAVLLWYLVIAGSYNRMERVFLLLPLALFAYPVAVVLARPDWGAVARGVVPSLSPHPDYLLLIVALVGTTITPYMQVFQQSSIVEKSVARRHYGPERLDAYVGAIFGTLMAASIVIATGTTLHMAGKTDIATAADAAQALQPVAGAAAQALFATGLLGGSLLAGAVVPLATAYAVSDAFGFRKGVNLDFRRARMFLGLYSALILIGAAVALIPNLPLVPLLIGIQVLNGILLPIILVFVLFLVNDRRVAGDLANTRLDNLLGWGTLALAVAGVVTLLGTQGLGLFGFTFFGGQD